VDWSGFYGGVQLEFGRGDVDYGVVPGAGFADSDLDGHLYGIFFGYRHDYGTVILGTEFDYMTGSLDADLPGITSVDRVVRATLELGMEAGNAFVYGTAGLAGVSVTTPILIDDTDWGGVFGVGVDYRLNDRTTVGAELLQHQVSDFNGSGADVSFTTFGVNIGFQF
jgi:opacity protein-like surface antigen